MKIPKKVKVFGHEVKIKRVRRISSKGTNYAGLAYLAGDSITLAKEDCSGCLLSNDYNNEVFLHELLHHVNDKCDAGLSEIKIRRFSRGLYQVLKDNKLKFF